MNKKILIGVIITTIFIIILISIIAYLLIILKKIDNCDNTSIMAEYNLEIIPNSSAAIAKGPHWDLETQSLYYTDIYEHTLYRYDFNENKIYKCVIEKEKISTVIIPIEGHINEFAIAMGRFVKVIEWDGKLSNCKVKQTLFEVEKDVPGNRFNDCKADPKGRFVGGTTHQENDLFAVRSSNLWLWENGHNPVKLKSGVGISNGLIWDLKINKFYYADSADHDIKQYDYDIKSGNITNMKILTDFHLENGGRPNFVADSMALDTEGNIYVALFGASKVVKIDSKTGKIVQDINLPVKFITSCTFGGPNMDILFVTTAAINDQPAPAGQTFKVTGLGVTGMPSYKLKLN